MMLAARAAAGGFGTFAAQRVDRSFDQGMARKERGQFLRCRMMECQQLLSQLAEVLPPCLYAHYNILTYRYKKSNEIQVMHPARVAAGDAA